MLCCCREAIKAWKKLVTSVSDITPSLHGNCQKANSKALCAHDIREEVVVFIKNYAGINGLSDPGRQNGAIRDFYLESSTTMLAVFNEYCSSLRAALSLAPQPHVSCICGGQNSLTKNSTFSSTCNVWVLSENIVQIL